MVPPSTVSSVKSLQREICLERQNLQVILMRENGYHACFLKMANDKISIFVLLNRMQKVISWHIAATFAPSEFEDPIISIDSLALTLTRLFFQAFERLLIQ